MNSKMAKKKTKNKTPPPIYQQLNLKNKLSKQEKQKQAWVV